jgi:TRAP transporter TAXI family solute receptor
MFRYQRLERIWRAFSRRPNIRAAWPANVRRAALLFASLAAVSHPTLGQSSQSGAGASRSSSFEEALKSKLNANTILVAAGSPSETYLEIANDLAVVLNDDNMRILPIAGVGGAQNIRDLLYLKSVDAGITSTPMLRYFASTGELGAALDQRVTYITKLFVEEMHVLAGPNVNRFEDLNGKKVNFSNIGSSTQITARDVFGLLSIAVQEVNINQTDAIEKIKSGEIAATVLFSGQPVNAFSRVSSSDNLHLLAVPFTPTLENTYVPASLEAESYPNLIAQGQSVQTVGIDAVLITNSWAKTSKRYPGIASFVEAFFDRFAEFRRPPRHPKWLGVNLAADLPGWQRFPAAQEWLEHARQVDEARLQGQFEKFLAQAQRPGTPALSETARQQLFRDFLNWSARQQ